MLSIRELTVEDIPLIADYWLLSDPAYLVSLGVDLAKLPARDNLISMLHQVASAPLSEKLSYALIWEVDGLPVGHCNVNQIVPKEEAFMHLHLWSASNRQQGLGAALVKMSIQQFFEALELKRLYCEPYALNPAPNNTLRKMGFTLVKEHVTIPGSLNFEQPVKLWMLTREELEATLTA